LAGSTGLEPAASGVTGRRSNQLNYDPDSFLIFDSLIFDWCLQRHVRELGNQKSKI